MLAREIDDVTMSALLHLRFVNDSIVCSLGTYVDSYQVMKDSYDTLVTLSADADLLTVQKAVHDAALAWIYVTREPTTICIA